MININTIRAISRAIAEEVFRRDLTSSVSTTDDTPTAILTLTPDDNSAGIIWVMCSGYTGTDGITGIKTVRFIKTGDVVTLGTGAIPMATERDGLTTADFDITASGADLIVRVTGEAATDINWKADHKFINVVKEPTGL